MRFIIFFAGIVLGASGASGIWWYNWPNTIIAASSSDVAQVITKLLPVSDVGEHSYNVSDLSIDTFSDGSVLITVKNHSNENHGQGASLNEAVANLKSESAAIAKALK